MSTFAAAIDPLLKREGSRYVADDHGRGPSKWGITLATLRELMPTATAADIQALGPAQASVVYRVLFWQRYRLALIDEQALATKLLDLAVNLGGGTAVKLLQRAVGVQDDGVLGPKTAAAVNSRPGPLVLEQLRTEAAQRYRNIVLAHPEWQEDLAGWLVRLSQ